MTPDELAAFKRQVRLMAAMELLIRDFKALALDFGELGVLANVEETLLPDDARISLIQLVQNLHTTTPDEVEAALATGSLNEAIDKMLDE